MLMNFWADLIGTVSTIHLDSKNADQKFDQNMIWIQKNSKFGSGWIALPKFSTKKEREQSDDILEAKISHSFWLSTILKFVCKIKGPSPPQPLIPSNLSLNFKSVQQFLQII